MKQIVKLNDGTALEVGLAGSPDRPGIMLPVFKQTLYGKEADNLRMWGVDPELGTHLVEGLSDRFRIIYFDYEGHLMSNPRPDQLTPETICQDFLQIADEMSAATFSYYGYSWLALTGLQLAITSNRVESLVMGGFPPLGGPYKEMLTVTSRTHEQALQQQNRPGAPLQYPNGPGNDPDSGPDNTSNDFDWSNVRVTLDPNQTKQFHTLYEQLRNFDDNSVQESLKMPRLAFAGEKDTIVYGENFGGMTVDIAGAMRRHQEALTNLGWEIVILPGDDMNHTKAMQPSVVLPLIIPWLTAKLLR